MIKNDPSISKQLNPQEMMWMIDEKNDIIKNLKAQLYNEDPDKENKKENAKILL